MTKGGDRMKKRYHKPMLIVRGSVRDLTLVLVSPN